MPRVLKARRLDSDQKAMGTFRQSLTLCTYNESSRQISISICDLHVQIQVNPLNHYESRYICLYVYIYV